MNHENIAKACEDIQALVMKGFVDLAHAGYGFFEITEKREFKEWLSAELDAQRMTPASVSRPTSGMHQSIAFTARGLRALLGGAWLENSFPAEFVEGMVQPHRSRLLGDYGDSAPENWRWGYGQSMDGVLIVFGETAAAVTDRLDHAMTGNGLKQVFRQLARIPADRKEPFGFRDGISQPVIRGTKLASAIQKDSRAHRLHVVAPGEFILGFRDGSGCLPYSPAVSPAVDPNGLLRPHHQRAELRDFGANGSYVVIRQLRQDVEAFSAFMKEHSFAGFDPAEKMLGRTRDGQSLTADPSASGENDFDYLHDLDGRGCPIGAHVRRANPRSTVHDISEHGSLAVSNRHRIIRRGRVYHNNDGETGLMFLCLNASINRQYEFVQSTWCNDPFFQGLAAEVDPVIGTRRERAEGFTVPRKPYRYRIRALPQWVTVVGGGYFFMPGMKALSVLVMT